MEYVICWKDIFCDISNGSQILDRRQFVNTIENAMSPTDIFISNWSDNGPISSKQCDYEMDYSF